MREWRKLHKAILSSERLSAVSYEARWLYTLLLVAQDDAGQYPWTRTMVRTLVATTDWGYGEATELRQELEAAGLGSMQGDCFILRNGTRMNGTPTSGKGAGLPRYYPVPDEGSHREVAGKSPGSHREVLEESREEESREEEKRAAAATRVRAQEPPPSEFIRAFATGWDGRHFPPMSVHQLQELRAEITEWEARWHREPPVAVADYVLAESENHAARNWAYAQAVLRTCREWGGVPPPRQKESRAPPSRRTGVDPDNPAPLGAGLKIKSLED